MLRQATLARTALIAALALPTFAASAADAASVSVANKCYVAFPGTPDFPAVAEPIPAEVEELTPGREVRLTVEVKGVQTASTAMLTADRRGDLTTTIDQWITGMPFGPTKGTDARVVVRDFWLGTELAGATIDVVNLGVHIDDVLIDYRTKRRWIVSGLSLLGGSKSYYAHFFANSSPNSKYLGKMYLGATADRCGFMRAKRPLAPFRKTGNFMARIQASPTWKPKLPSTPITIEVKQM